MAHWRIVCFLFVTAVLIARPSSAQRTVFRSVESSAVVPQQTQTPRIDLRRVGDHIHSLVNLERTRRGLAPLERDPALEQIGARHSEDMAANGYFDHVDLRGRDATQRAHAGKYICLSDMQSSTPVSIGENLFAGFRYSAYSLRYYPGEVVADFTWKDEGELAREAVDAWMDSPPHRKNLLHPAYHSHGIGIFVTSSLEIFVTQNLC